MCIFINLVIFYNKYIIYFKEMIKGVNKVLFIKIFNLKYWKLIV